MAPPAPCGLSLVAPWPPSGEIKPPLLQTMPLNEYCSKATIKEAFQFLLCLTCKDTQLNRFKSKQGYLRCKHSMSKQLLCSPFYGGSTCCERFLDEIEEAWWFHSLPMTMASVLHCCTSVTAASLFASSEHKPVGRPKHSRSAVDWKQRMAIWH